MYLPSVHTKSTQQSSQYPQYSPSLSLVFSRVQSGHTEESCPGILVRNTYIIPCEIRNERSILLPSYLPTSTIGIQRTYYKIQSRSEWWPKVCIDRRFNHRQEEQTIKPKLTLFLYIFPPLYSSPTLNNSPTLLLLTSPKTTQTILSPSSTPISLVVSSL